MSKKVGYHYRISSSRYNVSVERWLEIYCTDQTTAVHVAIGSFLNTDVFTLLRILIQKNPNVLVGSNLAQALQTGIFPKKQPLIMFSFKPVEVQDTEFVPIQPGQYVSAGSAQDQPSVTWSVVVTILQFAGVIVGVYALGHYDIPLFVACFVAELLFALIVMAIQRSRSHNDW